MTLVTVLALAASGCGTASAPSPPAGVDELVIPTPSPDPSDFTAVVDNPWLALPADEASYVVTDATGTHRLVVSVEPGPEIDGVATTAAVTVERGVTTTDWYAEDRRGNVWWFGREGEWQAGSDGAEAGLAMAATPRIGDGYRTGYLAGTVEDVATVESLEDDELTVGVASALSPGVTRQLTYRRDVGLVRDVEPTRTVELVTGG